MKLNKQRLSHKAGCHVFDKTINTKYLKLCKLKYHQISLVDNKVLPSTMNSYHTNQVV